MWVEYGLNSLIYCLKIIKRLGMKQLFLSPTGRIPRRKFWMGFIGLFVFILAVNTYLANFPQLYVSFWIALVFPFLALYLIYCIYGKRLHDLGQSYWPLTGAIVLELAVIIGVMLAFGGADYFYEFSQYERKAVIDPDVRETLITEYQAEISSKMHIIQPLLLVVPVLFTLFLGTKTGQQETNKYGSVPTG